MPASGVLHSGMTELSPVFDGCCNRPLPHVRCDIPTGRENQHFRHFWLGPRSLTFHSSNFSWNITVHASNTIAFTISEASVAADMIVLQHPNISSGVPHFLMTALVASRICCTLHLPCNAWEVNDGTIASCEAEASALSFVIAMPAKMYEYEYEDDEKRFISTERQVM